MQGLPLQIFPKSSKVESFNEKKPGAEAQGEVVVKGGLVNDSSKTEKNDFASLLANLTGKDKDSSKKSEVKSELGETLKNLLIEKNQENTEVKTKDKGQENGLQKKDENLESINPKTIDILMPFISSKDQNKDKDKDQSKDQKSGKNSLGNAQGKVEQALTKTSSNIEQLLSELKSAQNPKILNESNEVENENLSQEKALKKDERQVQSDFESEIKLENKSENKSEIKPGIKSDNKLGVKSEKKSDFKLEHSLDFLVNSPETTVDDGNDISLPITSRETDNNFESKKIMTGEDYLKSMGTSEKKDSDKLVLLNDLPDFQKNNGQNLKGYAQGSSHLGAFIKNTKDISLKDSKKLMAEDKKENQALAIDELRSSPKIDMRQGAELSVIKQDELLGIQNNKIGQGQAAGQTEANQKILDLSKINTTNTNEIIKRISDYVEQNQVANKSSLDLTVKHEALGEFKIQVSKMPNQSLNQGPNIIDMQITTSSKEGHDFFVKNEVSLMKNLNQAGIHLSDLRIVSTMSESNAFGQSDSRQSSFFGQNSDGSDKKFMSFESDSFSNSSSSNSSRNFSSDSRSGSERRKDLWEEYQQRYGA